MQSRRRRPMLAAAALGLLAACGSETATAPEPRTSTPSGSAAAATRSVTPSDTPSVSGTSRPTPVVTAGDERLAAAFVRFAQHPTTTAAQLPLAERVRLGLGSRVALTLKRSRASDPMAWVIDPPHFRAYTGPFSALELVERHTRQRPGSLQVSVGPNPHCVGPSVPRPRGLADHRRVSIQPDPSTSDSCLSWFTVDLFVDQHGEIGAVTLDVWEP